MPGANGTLSATTANVPLQMGSGDTTSPNGSLPQGNVSMDQIMGLMKAKDNIMAFGERQILS